MVTLWALVGALPTFVMGHALARAVDGFIDGRPTVGLVSLGVLVAAVPLGALGARQMYLGVARLVEPLRDDLVRSVVQQALRRAPDDGPARDDTAVARLTQHVEAVRETVAGLLLLVLGFVAGVIAALAGLLTLAPAVVPLVVVPLLASGAAFAASLPALTRQQRRSLLADESLADAAGNVAEGLRDVVASGAEETVAADLDGRIDEQVAATRSLARLTAVRTLIVSVGGRVPVVLVLLASPWLLRRGVSEGELLGTLTYLLQGLEPAVSSVVAGVGVPLAQLTVTVRRLDDAGGPPVAALEPAGSPPQDPSDMMPAPAGHSQGSADGQLTLRNVTFRYREDADPVLDNLNLDVAAGDHLAVVGPSGVGKSTLAGLLVGTLRPQVGDVRNGGRRADEVPAQARVLIPQHAYVFRGTLAENLRYLHPQADELAVDRAVAAVGMEELARRLGGYQAVVEPGALSMGERQLVALARAYLAPAHLVVLDEATCYLDPTAEAVAEQAFAARPDTLVVVAHRISSARRAHRILLVDGTQQLIGTHDELLDCSALYRDLVGHWLDPAET
jgi:ATP-binding cassette subfamily C protein